ncbi:DNA helicase [Podospora pseudopauciseta]|uniref:ATP-dependent DNA helicase PIF1 n=1 Tax=Podospora pseudopauciseta TaxID=2093780 RepID=A0ABR0H0U4_9PEZI|nr:DNA helicase [Podospora pseudopauciseta]
MPGLTSHLLHRALPTLERNPVLSTRCVPKFRAYVHSARLTPQQPRPPQATPVSTATKSTPTTTATMGMFERATAAAANQQSQNSSRNASLKKQLFPSSSPNPVSTSIAKVDEMFLRASQQPPPAHRPSQFSSTTDPLNSQSSNISRPPVTNPKSNTLSSICSTNGSFADKVEVIHIADDTPPPQNFTNEWDLDEDDFSDEIDLDWEAPSALPEIPRAPPKSNPQKSDLPIPTSEATLTSWPDSSPSHFAPPRARAQPAPQAPAPKREYPYHAQQAPEVVKKPKRELPPAWKKEQAITIEDREAHDHRGISEATPDAKPKATSFWDATASAVKAQKKQLKTQQKGSGGGKPVTDDVSWSDVHDAVDQHVKASKSSNAKAAAIQLSQEQRHVKNLVVEKGQSVFFTGPAGTGKSVLMRSIITDLRKKYARDPEKLAVTASTGLAACNIGGITLHSFSGIGLGKEDVNTLVKKIRRNPKAKNRWIKTKTLIIDEISMVDSDLFDKLSQIGRILRNNGRPWGGIQLVITGDFFQLPPVPEGGREHRFAFDAATWSLSIDHTIGLTEVFRQRDPGFAEMLNEMRLGKISDKTVKNFQALKRPLTFSDGIQVTELFPTRSEVERSNKARLDSLKGSPHTFQAADQSTLPENVREKLFSNMMAPPTLDLKKGAQVMLIKNMDETLVNGSLGTVEGFATEDQFGIDNGLEDESDTKKRVRAFTNALENNKNAVKYPVVRFHAVDGSQRVLLCVPEEWKVELPNGEVQASRKQLPLILAWALSIHKAQGQTMERVKVDLNKIFEKGQAYVALSRATTQEGLQVLNFNKTKVMAHPRVINFYNSLYGADVAVKKKTGTLDDFAYQKPAVAAPAKPAAAPAATTQRRAPVYDDFDADEEEAMASFG